MQMSHAWDEENMEVKTDSDLEEDLGWFGFLHDLTYE